MSAQLAIYEHGLDEFSKSRVLFTNGVMILWIVLGTIACGYINPFIGLLYLLFAVGMILFVLRKLLCTNCYYYGKWCSTGWGKLAALFFQKGSIEEFSNSRGQKLAPVTYGVLLILPLGLVGWALLQTLTIDKLLVLLLLLLVAVYSGAISRKTACTNCKIRLICPGCAVSNE